MHLLAVFALLVASTDAVSAPGDQYFGRMKMSAIRIRYEFNQLRPRYEEHLILPEDAQHSADMAQDAYYAWARAYPKDPWLASTAYLMAELYIELPGSGAHTSTVRALTFIKKNFPSTSYAKKAAASLHTGPPVRPDPQWAVAMRAAEATPTPSPEPSPSASSSPASSPNAEASPSPSPSSSPP